MKISWRFIRDDGKRVKYSTNEFLLKLYKSMLEDERIKPRARSSVYRAIYNLKGYESRIKNRCILTNRGRGIYSNPRLSRHLIKKYAHLL